MKKMANRLLAVLLVLIMGLGLLSACSSNDATSNTTKPPATTPAGNGDTTDLHTIIALTVGDIEVSVIEYKIYYSNMEYNLSQDYQDNGLDASGDAFYAEVSALADEEIQFTVAMAAEARKNGVTLSEDYKAYIDETMASIDSGASEAGVSADDFVAQYVGEGVTRADYEKYMSDGLLAEQWRTAKIDSFTYNQADYDAFYSQHPDRADTVSFRYYVISPEDPGEDATEDAVAAVWEAARVKAEAFSSEAVSEDAFAESAVEYAAEEDKAGFQDDPDATLIRHANISELGDQSSYNYYWVNEEQRAWLADPAREAGDKTVSEWGNGQFYIVFYFISRQRPDYHSVNIRHILFLFKDDEGSSASAPTDAQKEAAKQQAQDAYDQWKAGEATEGSFAALADAVSEDTGSNTTGGLYENVTLGAMVQPFEAWCFDAARKAGDTGLVETVYGYHVMYYSSQNDTPEWMNVLHDQLAEDDINAYFDGLKESYPLVKNDYGMSLTS